jgi:hypothetical protein
MVEEGSMRRHNGSWLVLVAVTLLAPGAAGADMPCRMGGVVAKSANGSFELVSSSYGCRHYPERSLQIVPAGKQGAALVTVKEVPWYGQFWVANDGKTVLVDLSKEQKEPDPVLAVSHNGAALRKLKPSEILPAKNKAVAEKRFLKLEFSAEALKIKDLDGTLYKTLSLKELIALGALPKK